MERGARGSSAGERENNAPCQTRLPVCMATYGHRKQRIYTRGETDGLPTGTPESGHKYGINCRNTLIYKEHIGKECVYILFLLFFFVWHSLQTRAFPVRAQWKQEGVHYGSMTGSSFSLTNIYFNTSLLFHCLLQIALPPPDKKNKKHKVLSGSAEVLHL